MREFVFVSSEVFFSFISTQLIPSFGSGSEENCLKMRCFCSDYQTWLINLAFHSNLPSLVQSFTPYRTAQRPIVTATQVGSHIRVGEACGSAVQLLFAVSPSFLGWQFAPFFWVLLRALSSLEISLIELSEWIKWYPPMMFKSFSWMTFKFQVSMSKVL